MGRWRGSEFLGLNMLGIKGAGLRNLLPPAILPLRPLLFATISSQSKRHKSKEEALTWRSLCLPEDGRLNSILYPGVEGSNGPVMFVQVGRLN